MGKMKQRAPLEHLDNDGTKSLKEICNGSYGELQWLLPDILPLEGVTILVGSPKSGKSLFLLNTAISYLLGDVILGFFPPVLANKKILYLDLESSNRRIKHRADKCLPSSSRRRQT